MTAAEAEIIGLLIAGNSTMQTFPQGFSSLFNQDVIGIISKIDLVDSEEQLEFARKQLLDAGVKRIFEISSTENTGIDALKDFLESE